MIFRYPQVPTIQSFSDFLPWSNRSRHWTSVGAWTWQVRSRKEVPGVSPVYDLFCSLKLKSKTTEPQQPVPESAVGIG